MATVTDLNNGNLIQGKIFSDSVSSSCSYGNQRQKIYTGTILAGGIATLPDIIKIKTPDAVMLQTYLTLFATDGTVSSQILTTYNCITQLTNGGAQFITANTNGISVNVNAGVTSPTPMVAVTFTVDAANNSLNAVFNAGVGTQQRSCRYTAVFTQFSSIPY